MAGIRFARLKKIGQQITEPKMKTGISARKIFSLTMVDKMYVKIIHIKPYTTIT